MPRCLINILSFFYQKFLELHFISFQLSIFHGVLPIKCYSAKHQNSRSIKNNHYSDAIMSVMASQIASLIIVYSTAYSGVDKKNIKAPRTGLFDGNSVVTGEFPAQRASNMKNVSIWWRHHECRLLVIEGATFRCVLSVIIRWHATNAVHYFLYKIHITVIICKACNITWSE